MGVRHFELFSFPSFQSFDWECTILKVLLQRASVGVDGASRLSAVHTKIEKCSFGVIIQPKPHLQIKDDDQSPMYGATEKETKSKSQIRINEVAIQVVMQC